jgi:hypothetical protein
MSSVADVRTLVARRVGINRRVAVLGSDAALISALQNNGCEVLVDPAGLEALSTFSPHVVVAFDGFALDDGRGAFAMLASAVPGAELVFSFAHAGSATAALKALTGATPERACAERDVTAWLRAAGYVVTSRDVVVVPHVSTGVSADTEAALRQLFEQLNPDAAADRLLLVAKRGMAASEPDRTHGLLSVIISAATDGPALEGTVASLLGQQQRPLEIVLSSALSLEKTDAVLAKARARAGVTTLAPHSDSADWAARSNAGLAHATGQYVALLEAGDVVTPFHYSTLVKRLGEGTRAWALATTGADQPSAFSFAAWLASGVVARQTCIIDRERTATLPLQFAEGIEGAQSMRFARLAALFEPELTASGTPSIDVFRPTTESLETLTAAMRTRPLRVLTTLTELLKRPAPPRIRDLLKRRIETLGRR